MEKNSDETNHLHNYSPVWCRLVNNFSSNVLSCIVKFSINKQSNALRSFSDVVSMGTGRIIDMITKYSAWDDAQYSILN